MKIQSRFWKKWVLLLPINGNQWSLWVLRESRNVKTHGLTVVTLMLLIKLNVTLNRQAVPQPCHTAQYEANCFWGTNGHVCWIMRFKKKCNIFTKYDAKLTNMYIEKKTSLVFWFLLLTIKLISTISIPQVKKLGNIKKQQGFSKRTQETTRVAHQKAITITSIPTCYLG